ncbi:MAG: hypothetical protein LBI05_09470 [Planctomycetaceae bacterium]|jgi:hypothetical protein|nr:hypothetical protein [Planctomycetaceae bacterium]
MDLPLSSQFLIDDDEDDADDFDLDFDEDYEFISDEEFEVIIDYDEYDSDDSDVLDGELCLDDPLDDFDPSENRLEEKDFVDEE